MPLESAALQEEEAWPPKSDIGPGRFDIARLGGEKGGVSLVESTSLLVLLVNAGRMCMGCQPVSYGSNSTMHLAS